MLCVVIFYGQRVSRWSGGVATNFQLIRWLNCASDYFPLCGFDFVYGFVNRFCQVNLTESDWLVSTGDWLNLTDWLVLTDWICLTELLGDWLNLTGWFGLTDWICLTGWLGLTDWLNLTDWLAGLDWLTETGWVWLTESNCLAGFDFGWIWLTGWVWLTESDWLAGWDWLNLTDFLIDWFSNMKLLRKPLVLCWPSEHWITVPICTFRTASYLVPRSLVREVCWPLVASAFKCQIKLCMYPIIIFCCS